MNKRKKRCTHPACRRMYSYWPGEALVCPWCEHGSAREGFGGGHVFHYGESVPELNPHFNYDVRLEGYTANRLLAAIRIYRRTVSEIGGFVGLIEARDQMFALRDGRRITLSRLTASQVRSLMEEGEFSLNYWGKRKLGNQARVARL